MAICMVRRALSSIGTREKKKVEERRTKKQGREQIKKRGQQKKKENKGRRKTKERKKGVHTATHDATQARPPNFQPVVVPVC